MFEENALWAGKDESILTDFDDHLDCSGAFKPASEAASTNSCNGWVQYTFDAFKTTLAMAKISHASHRSIVDKNQTLFQFSVAVSEVLS